MTSYYLDSAGSLKQELTISEITGAMEAGSGLLWLDFQEMTEAEATFLQEKFCFHTLAIEDCRSGHTHPPKVDVYEDHLFMIFHGIDYATESELVNTTELAIFLGANFVVSSHNTALYSIAGVRQQLAKSSRPLKHGADYLAYALLDALVDNILPTIDIMVEIAEQIDDEVLARPSQATLKTILSLKKSSLRIHRVMAPQREVLNRISRGDFDIVREESRIYFRDVYDHVVRIDDLNQNVRDMADNALSTYLSTISNRQNEIMKVLSIVAAIFLPLTLLVGIYGMNFAYMPELQWHYGYFAVIGVILLVIIGVIWYFWFKRWFNWGRGQAMLTGKLRIDRRLLKGYGALRKKPAQPE